MKHVSCSGDIGVQSSDLNVETIKSNESCEICKKK